MSLREATATKQSKRGDCVAMLAMTVIYFSRGGKNGYLLLALCY